MKHLHCFLVFLICVCLLSGCGNGAQPLDMQESEIGEGMAEEGEEPEQSEALGGRETEEQSVNTGVFDVDVYSGTLTAEVFYSKDPRMGTAFLLNRDFTVTSLVCDGKEIDPESINELVVVFDDYTANQYTLPHFEESLTIHYTGALTGQTGCSPYVRETISPEFSMLRWETFCYPLFGTGWDSLLDTLDPDESLPAKITVRVPGEYVVATPYIPIGQQEDDQFTSHHFEGDLFHLDCAIAQYELLKLPSGSYYFLPGTDLTEMEALINPVMTGTHQFMHDTYGEVEIPTTMNYIMIPEGFGSYALEGRASFVVADAFQSTEDLMQLVHEYIHLGWNAMVQDRSVQRCRFFDEGFTCYFTARVGGHLLGEEYYQSEIEWCKQSLKRTFEADESMLVPLVEYGQYEIGGLSYRLGPVLFDELASLVGTDVFDEATREFLAKYWDTPVDFEIMVQEYIELCGNAELEEFFQDWIYSTEGIQQVLA